MQVPKSRQNTTIVNNVYTLHDHAEPMLKISSISAMCDDDRPRCLVAQAFTPFGWLELEGGMFEGIDSS